jgi:XTP/dITP diphosphohydrolase
VERLNAVLASRNPNKARELELLLPGWTIEPLDADDYPPETGTTYYENAREKASFGRTRAESDAWVLGEDSGLEVDALDGGPGVRSARLGGEEPVGWLLERLTGVKGEDRRARYVSELVALTPAGVELRGTGTLSGRIGAEARGTEGFGYDPIFIPEGERRTVAELGNEWKALHSHRALAARALVAATRSGQPG